MIKNNPRIIKDHSRYWLSRNRKLFNDENESITGMLMQWKAHKKEDVDAIISIDKILVFIYLV